MRHLYAAFILFMSGLTISMLHHAFYGQASISERFWAFIMMVIFAISIHWGWTQFQAWGSSEDDE